jgi:hypothetical protein
MEMAIYKLITQAYFNLKLKKQIMEKRNLISWLVGLTSAVILTTILRSVGMGEYLTGWLSCLAFIYTRIIYLKGF